MENHGWIYKNVFFNYIYADFFSIYLRSIKTRKNNFKKKVLKYIFIFV